MLATATAVGRVYVTKIKTNPGHSENPEAASISAGLELLPRQSVEKIANLWAKLKHSINRSSIKRKSTTSLQL
jgi:hypothetical protein